MRCRKCEFDNPPGMKFCGKCRASLGLICPDCAFENPPGFDFCGQCAAALNPPVSGPVVASAPMVAAAVQSPEAAGERRHLTVLFCDLVGSTAMAAQLDPEEWRETVSEYHRMAAEAITRFGGHVVKYLGDGVMALFGWPAAHDNDAERAARAGLAIIDALAKLGAGYKGEIIRGMRNWRRESASIRGRWWWAEAPVAQWMSSATRRISRRGSRRRPPPARC